jgi:hypothetical protein
MTAVKIVPGFSGVFWHDRAFTLLLGTAVYVLVHFLIYALTLRERAAFRTEKGIFRLHVFSVLVLALGISLVLGKALTNRDIAAVIGAFSIHGIYTISFLELWSLAEGGYSLKILRTAAAGDDPREGGALLALQAVGQQKRANRLAALRAMGLIAEGPEGLVLTVRGKSVASFLRAIAWIANLRSLG